MVGMRTSMAMDGAPVSSPRPGTWQLRTPLSSACRKDSTGEPAGSFRRRAVLPRAVLRSTVPRGDPYFLLAHLTVHDTERPELGPIRLPGGYQDIVRPGLAGVGDVGAGRVGLGRGVGVVDDHRLLVAIVHLPPHPQLLKGVEPVERRGPLGVEHGDEPFRPIAPGRARDHPARLVRMIGTGMSHDLLVEHRTDRQHEGEGRACPGRPDPPGPAGPWGHVTAARGPGTPAGTSASRRRAGRPLAGPRDPVHGTRARS